jgi:hypothetical protein
MLTEIILPELRQTVASLEGPIVEKHFHSRPLPLNTNPPKDAVAEAIAGSRICMALG